jgi:endonuclease YncB( thermonuclease family)
MIRKCFFVLILTICNTHAASLTGTVVAVADGDTITVLDSNNRKHRIRLIGIDAPEKSQSYGQRSKHSLAELVYDKNVTIHYEKQDRYARTLGKVLVDGRDVNLLQIERGMAWWYRAYKQDQTIDDRVFYQATEHAARLAKVGLWAEKSPIPPWDFRRTKRLVSSP